MQLKRGNNIYLLAIKYICSVDDKSEDSILITNFEQYVFRTNRKLGALKSMIMLKRIKCPSSY